MRHYVSPFNRQRALFKDLEEIFESFDEGLSQSLHRPQVDIEEAENAYRVSVDLPGMKKKDIEVSVEDKVLKIRAEKKELEKKGLFGKKKERQWGVFERHLRLPESIEQDGVKAQFKQGVLKLQIPKTAQAQAQKIEIK